MDEGKSSETHYYSFLEISEEHTHEENGCEVGYSAYLALIFVNRYAELIPCGFLCVSVPQFDRTCSFVGNEVFAYDQIGRTNADMILVIFLIFVKSIVLIYVLHVRCRFIRSVVSFR